MGKRLITAGDVWRPMGKKPPDRRATVLIVAAVVVWVIIPVRTVRALPHLQLQVMGVRILPIFLMVNVVTKVTKNIPPQNTKDGVIGKSAIMIIRMILTKNMVKTKKARECQSKVRINNKGRWWRHLSVMMVLTVLRLSNMD